jgi:hypothetical protein
LDEALVLVADFFATAASRGAGASAGAGAAVRDGKVGDGAAVAMSASGAAMTVSAFSVFWSKLNSSERQI